MKKIVYLSAILLMFASEKSFPQEINKLQNNVTIWKGTISFKDGNYESFKNLKLNGDLIIFKDLKDNLSEKDLSDVYSISKRSNYAGYGALVGGLFGLLFSLTYEGDVQQGNLPDESNRGQQYVAITCVSVAVGGLVGMMFKKQKTIYLSQSPLTLSSSVFKSPEGKHYPMLSLQFNFR